MHTVYRSYRCTPQRILAGFTVIEMAIVVGTMGIVAGISLPMYQRFMARSSLEIARQNVAQGIERARLLSLLGINDAIWGFSTNAIPGRGVLFMGRSFTDRDSAYDELYTIPRSISVSGLTEVTFSKLLGEPSAGGDIVFRSMYDDEAIVTVNLGTSGEVDVPESWMNICIDPYGTNPQTIRVPDSLWTSYQVQGALMGGCSEVGGSSSSSSESSISTTSGGSSESSSSTTMIDVDDEGVITPDFDYTFSMEILGTSLDISSGYSAPITMRFKQSGAPFVEPWGKFQKPVNGNINGTDPPIYYSNTISAGTELYFWSRSYRKKKSWHDGTQNNHFNLKKQLWTPHNEDLAFILVNNDPIPNGVTAPYQSFLVNYLDVNNNTVDIADNQVLMIFELWSDDASDPDSDWQDLAVLLTFYPA